MLKLLWCEYVKLKRSKILLIGLLGTLIVPVFVVAKAVGKCLSQSGTPISLFSLYDDAIMFIMLLFGPMVLTMIGAWMISREYSDGTLKNIFAIPVSAARFLTGKFLFFAALALSFMLISWFEILILAFLCRFFFPVTELTALSAFFFLVRMLFGGILLFATQTPFLFLAVRTKGIAAPFIGVAAVSLINVVLSGSPVAGFYPWSASYLLLSGRFARYGYSKEIAILVIMAACLSGLVASLSCFHRENI